MATGELKLHKVRYCELNARQKESYNYHKLAAVLAEYGYTSMRLLDDWQGADFIAAHTDGSTFLKVQLKGRCSFDKKYLGKNIYIAFPDEGAWFLYPHDVALEQLHRMGLMEQTNSWQVKGSYSFPSLSRKLRQVLSAYKLDQ